MQGVEEKKLTHRLENSPSLEFLLLRDVDLPAEFVHLQMLDEVRREAGVAVQHEVVVVATKNDRVEHDAALRKKFDDAIGKGFERQVQQ